MAFFWKRKQREMEIPPPPPKPRISIPSDLPSFPSSVEEKLPTLPPLEKKPEPPRSLEEAERLPPLPRFEPLPPLPPLEPEKEIKRAVDEIKPIVKPAPKPRFFRRPEIPESFPREMPRPIIRQEISKPVERAMPEIRQKPRTEIKKLKRGLLRGRELFVEVEDYRIIFEILTSLRENARELSESIERIEGFYEEEEQVFERWQNCLGVAQKKLMSVDKNLFR